MRKIDFFGGVHGNFLELVINVFVLQQPFDFNQPVFNNNGACHLKNQQPTYYPLIKANHWSYFDIPFNSTDELVEIYTPPEFMLAALTNSLLRAGDQVLNLNNLHIDTIEKLSAIDKSKIFLDNLIKEHGVQSRYHQNIIRNYFYSAFIDPKCGVNQFNNFKFTGKKITFPFDAFFSIEKFYYNLNKIAFFFNEDFHPTTECSKLHRDFLKVNQGYQSQIKCQQIIDNILNGISSNIEDCNLLEQAWINYRMAELFRCYDHPLLTADTYPTNTKQISDAMIEYKVNC